MCAGACGGRLDRSIPVPRGAEVEVSCCGVVRDGVELRYLGVGGWSIRSARGHLLTAPLFSNPRMLRTAVAPISWDSIRIREGLEHVGETDLSDVTDILVGHAHYDHLLDVPWILANRAPRARVLASRTAVLQGRTVGRELGVDPERFVEVSPGSVADPVSPGRWFTTGDGAFRVLAIRSDHAPHLDGLQLYRGNREVAPDRLDSADDWVEGETLAWLIDVLAADGSIALRIYYQDAVSREPRGAIPPPEVRGDDRGIDVAILVPATFVEARWYPEWILENVEPEFVLLGHWEDFFQPVTRPTEPVALTPLPDFITRLRRATGCDDACWALPEPGATFRFGGAGPAGSDMSDGTR